MLDAVEWTEVVADQNAEFSPDLPFATHEGVLRIAGTQLRCYRLNDGRAIFNADDIHELLGSVVLTTSGGA